MELLTGKVEETVKEKKNFKLMNDSIHMQLAYHFANLFRCFKPHNEESRSPLDRGINHINEEIFLMFDLMIKQEGWLDDFFLTPITRQMFPMEFRVQQLVQHYGKENIKNFINLIYGEGKVG